jgi:serine/threonine protein kinase
MSFQYILDIGKAGKFFIPINELKIEKDILANGQFSEVHKCMWRGTEIVIKKPKKYTHQNIHDFLIEVEVWSTLRHPNIAQFLGFSADTKNLIILMERIKGKTLTQHLTDWGIFPLIDSTKVCKQLIQLVNFLHSCNPPVIYRDLKPDNIMIDQNGNVKLIDFGLSRFIDTSEKEVSQMTGGTGTYRYMAPEVVKYEPYDSRADIYSLGIVMAYIMKRKLPLQNVDFNKYILSENSLSYTIPFCPKWTNIINMCVKYNYKDRPFASDLLAFVELDKLKVMEKRLKINEFV